MKLIQYLTLSLVIRIFIIIMIVSTSTQAIIGYGSVTNPLNVQCFGNFELVEGQCRPCKPGFVAQNRKCVQIGHGFYGDSTSDIQFVPTERDHNCKKVIRIGAGCLECNSGYQIDPQTHRCVISCAIYSQKLQRCVDGLDIQTLASLQEEKTDIKEQKLPQIILSEDKIHSIYDEQAFNLITFAQKNVVFELQISENTEEIQNQKTQIVTELLTKKNELQQNNVEEQNQAADQIFQKFPHCSDYREQMCFSCKKGYILNMLLQKCLQVNVPVKLRQNVNEINLSNQSQDLTVNKPSLRSQAPLVGNLFVLNTAPSS